nr:MAG TPA: hypothetical protein [Caudoviricetes sp.]
MTWPNKKAPLNEPASSGALEKYSIKLYRSKGV